MPAKLTQKEKARRSFAVAVKKVGRSRRLAWEAWSAMRNAKAHVEGIQFCSDASRIGEFLKKEMETLSEMAKQNNVGAYTLQSQASNLAEMLGLKER